MKKLLFICLLAGFIACDKQQSTPQPKPLNEQVTAFIQADEYDDAFALLQRQDESDEVLLLKEKTHLNYGLFLVYKDADVTSMRDRMNGALRQFIQVLKINPENEKAVSEIDQILGIYSTFPNRQPEEDVLAELKELGFDV